MIVLVLGLLLELTFSVEPPLSVAEIAETQIVCYRPKLFFINGEIVFELFN